MKKSLLIICYTFPPADGIGGRRWIKFAKYLKRQGCLVKIIAAKNGRGSLSQWIDDLQCLKDDVFYVNSFYPRWLTIRPKSIFEKILYKISLVYCKIFIKGNYFDKSAFMRPELTKMAKQLIKTYEIKNVVCSVGPFKMAKFSLELKKIFPNVNFIVDYRDPWTNNKTAFGYTSLSPKRYNYEVELEKYVLKTSSIITAVSKEMADYFRELVPESDSKFFHIPNGFDRDDIKNISCLTTELDNYKGFIKVVFSGTLYDKSEHVVNFLDKTLREISEGNMIKIKFFILGDASENLKCVLDKSDNFIFLGKRNLKEAYAFIMQADFCALFLTDDLDYSFSTKFYEYVMLRKPILSFSKNFGNNGKFLEDNSIGLSMNFSNMKERLMLLTDYTSQFRFYPSSFCDSAFNIENISSKVYSLLQ